MTLYVDDIRLRLRDGARRPRRAEVISSALLPAAVPIEGAQRNELQRGFNHTLASAHNMEPNDDVNGENREGGLRKR